MTTDSSAFIIGRDPFRAIRRGRQLFQRKFTRAQGQGPLVGDGVGDIQTNLAIGAGLADSCAACPGRPRGSAGFGGDVATRPDSRDAPHLFGLGLKEMLADEITADLRALRDRAVSDARQKGRDTTRSLRSKGIDYGTLIAHPDGTVDSSGVQGVDADLRVRPFFAHGGTISIREFVEGAFQNEMGLQAVDPDLAAAAHGARITTPAGMVLDGAKDKVEAPPTDDPTADPDGDGVANEIPTSLVDFSDFKRHDLGPNFHERDYDGSVRTQFLTTPLWGAGSTAPYGHDGRSVNLSEVILRHGGEAQAAAAGFAELSNGERRRLLEFLSSLILFPPDDTASNLNPGDRTAKGFPQFAHGSIKLSALFNNPAEPE